MNYIQAYRQIVLDANNMVTKAKYQCDHEATASHLANSLQDNKHVEKTKRMKHVVEVTFTASSHQP